MVSSLSAVHCLDSTRPAATILPAAGPFPFRSPAGSPVAPVQDRPAAATRTPPLARLAAGLSALILLGACAASPEVRGDDPAVMVREVSAMSGLPYDGQPLPRVVPTPRLNMDVIALMSNLAESCAAIGLDDCRMHGGYSHAHREIVIADDLSCASAQAVLAHELTHYLQGINGAPMDEPQAYAMQAEWLRRHPEGCGGAGSAT
jgi:hypothetical protein